MAKQILIDSSFGMVRTALAENSDLVDYYEESPDQGRNKGNIYRGVVKRVDAPIQAAFVKFSSGRDGFLPLRDASAGKPPKPGDSVLVQVMKDEVGDKGAALTAKLTFSGRYLVYIPERDGEGGISSKVSDEERAALKKVLGALRIPDGASVILRTAASEKSAEALQEDLDKLIAAHREIVEKFDAGGEPGLLFREAPPALRYLREYYTDEVARVWVNSHEAYEECHQFFQQYEPDSSHKVELSHDGAMLFHRMGLEAEVEKLAARRVGLKSGANIVIDQAEALVAIDVNSAKAGGRGEEGKVAEGKSGKGKRGRDRHRGGDLEETVFSVNKEAAAEIGRQLRLRDLGGIIIVDFIDMESEKHRRQIEDAMRKAMAGDKAKVKVYDISPLGIMQISRQRLRKSGHQFSRLACESCQGRGWHPSASAGALGVLRKLEERLHGKKAAPSLSVTVPYPVANKLMNEFREYLLAMEKRHGCALRLIASGTASGDPVIAQLGGGEGGHRNGEPVVRDAPSREGQPREAGAREHREREGQIPRHGGGREREGQSRDGRIRDGRPREAQGREESGRDGRGRNGQPQEANGQGIRGREERGRDGRNRNGRFREGQPREGQPRDGQPRDGQPRDGQPRDGQPRDGQPRDGQPRDGQPRDGQPRDGQPRDGQPVGTQTVPGADVNLNVTGPDTQPRALPQRAEADRDRGVQGGRDERGERGGRRRRGRGRGRDRGPREGGGEQGIARDSQVQAPVTVARMGIGLPQEAFPPGNAVQERHPDRPPHAGDARVHERAMEVAIPGDVFAPKAEVARKPEAVAEANEVAPRMVGARGRGRTLDLAPDAPMAQAAKPPVKPALVKGDAATAARARKGPQAVRPGSGRPAAEPKVLAPKAEAVARRPATKPKAAPAAVPSRMEASSKAGKPARPKQPAARASKAEGGTPAKPKSRD